MTIEGMAHTPTQVDSHAELQQRQGWSVKDMRDQIDSQAAEIERLQKELYESRDFWSKSNHDLLEQLQIMQRQLNGYQSKVGNALNYLSNVNCGNMAQGLVYCAVLELEDLGVKGGDHA